MTLTFRGHGYSTLPAFPYTTITKYRGHLTVVHHDPTIVDPAASHPMKYRGRWI
ncbi:DUF4278 domain-containing protein [Prochlorothrix hollandica]|uniref:DUF4278 domain-containing protein n=1 Tax=Prochlorothrix hollandica TaxID=1223 RepID=UPI000346BBA8|nr:DUF4278 domain-containing protein [Prochlorothrix hollandica]